MLVSRNTLHFDVDGFHDQILLSKQFMCLEMGSTGRDVDLPEHLLVFVTDVC
jgi:hypothetical protein